MLRPSSWLLLAWFSVSAACMAEENLLRNPGFEQGDGQRTAEAWSRAKQASHSLDSAKAKTGNGAVRVRFDDRFTQSIPANPDVFYVLSGYVRREDPAGTETPKIKIYFTNKEGKGIGGASQAFDGVTTQYTPFQFSFVPSSGAATVGVSLCGEFNGSEWFWYDDLEMVAKPRQEMPSAEATPSLNGKTVRVADIADCRSFALLRVPPKSLLPIDGLIGTECSTRRADYIKRPPAVCNFDLAFGGRAPVNCLLVHCPSPLYPVRSARIALREGRVVGEAQKNDAPTLFISFPRQETDWLRLAVDTAGGEARIGEIQAFDIADGVPQAPQPEYCLAPGKVPEDRVGDLALAFPRPEDQGVLLAQTPSATPADAAQALMAACYQSILLPPASAAEGVQGVQLRLDIESAEEPNLLEIALKRCKAFDQDLRYLEAGDRQLTDAIRSLPRYDLADRFRIYTKLNHGRNLLTVRFRFPLQLLETGERLWLSLRPMKGAVLRLGASRVAVEGIASERIEREALPQLLRMAQRLYSMETEAHPYDGLPYQKMALYRLVDRVLKTDPANEAANHILRRIARRRLNVNLKRPGPADAPDWAVWSREALRRYCDILCWWIDRRQVENGELGGDFNDDTEFSCKWPPFCLITGDSKPAQGLQKIADGCWEYMGESGYSISIMDVEHAAEDAQCSQPQMITVRYGDPEYLERLMLWSSYLPKWTTVNRNGDRLFRSYMFNARHVSAKPKEDIDHVYCAQAMAGPYTLAWYADTDIPRKWFLEWCRSWVKASMSTAKGKPAGAVPCDLLSATGEIAPYTKSWRDSVYYNFGQYTMHNAFVAGYMLSEDGFYLRPFEYQPNVATGPAGAVWRKVIGDRRHDDDFVGQADAQVAQYNLPVLEPAPGPERKWIACADKAGDVTAPMRLTKDNAAPGGAYLAAPRGSPEGAGSARLLVDVADAGRYAACVQMRSEDSASDSLFIKLDDGPETVVTTRNMHNEWVWATAAFPMELRAGQHTLTIRAREAGAMAAQAGVTSLYSTDGSWRQPSELTPYIAWLITGNKKYLVEQLKETCREMERMQWLLTEGEPCTDRVPVPGSELLPFLYLGGCAGGMKATFPYLALSWEGGGADFAALVLENDPRHLRALVYSFAVEPKDIIARVWELHHGEYEVLFGPDKDGDDRPDPPALRRQQVLRRHDPIPLHITPNQVYALEMKQVRPLDPILGRADLAISERDVTLDQGTTLRVTIHNVGAADAHDVAIVAQDDKGQALGSTRLAHLAAPTAAQAQRATVAIPLGRAASVVTVILDPQDRIPEITETNNAITVRP